MTWFRYDIKTKLFYKDTLYTLYFTVSIVVFIQTQHRAAERSENLRSHMNGLHNVITGEEHQRVTIPDKPSANFSKASHGK